MKGSCSLEVNKFKIFYLLLFLESKAKEPAKEKQNDNKDKLSDAGYNILF